MNTKMEEEWRTWLEVVNALKLAKAVTPKDCSSTLFQCNTPGQRIFCAIRAWGEALVAMRLEGGEK
jgi:hypothetical protein